MDKEPLSLRKKPKQRRSKGLVDDVLLATSKVLPEMGTEKATTNDIARAAGVSIGSLYQYFPNKQSIYSKLIEKIEDDHKLMIDEVVSGVVDRPIEEKIHPIISTIVQTIENKKPLLRALYRHISELQKLEYLAMTRRLIVDMIYSVLDSYPLELDERRRKAIAFTVVHSVSGVLQAMVQDPEALSPEEATEELVFMLQGYLKLSLESPTDR